MAPGRVHEGCGSARVTFAMLIARALAGPVLWIEPGWAAGRLNATGVARFIDPGRLIFVAPTREIDLLWTMEEALRSAAIPLVIADLPAPPALTPIRRLHLAAEAGAARAAPPLGLILTPGAGGASGVESRWHMDTAHGADGTTGWTLNRLRARMAPEKSWHVAATGSGFDLMDRAPAKSPA
ncbi:MAG: hypothetical protein AAFN59_01705 [Pseudomonadota bacterium]